MLFQLTGDTVTTLVYRGTRAPRLSNVQSFGIDNLHFSKFCRIHILHVSSGNASVSASLPNVD